MELFDGKKSRVKLSSGATYELYQALVIIAKQKAKTAAHCAVQTFLNDQMFHNTKSGLGFSFNPPPTLLTKPGQLNFFGELLSFFIHELTRKNPDPQLTSIIWDKELRLYWLAKILDLYQLVVDAISTPETLKQIHLELPEEDRIEVQLHQLMWQQSEITRTSNTSEPPLGVTNHSDKQNPIINITYRIIKLLIALPETTERKMAICRQHENLADLYVTNGDNKKGAALYRKAISFIDDDADSAEYRDDLAEYTASLEE